MTNELSVFKDSQNALMIPDDLYEAIGFREIFTQKQSQADMVLSKVADVVNQAATGSTVKKGLSKEVQYVVDMSDELKHSIENGSVRLDYSKTGEIYAQLRDANNHFGEKLPIKKELVAAGIDPMAVSTALQMKAIEHKLDEMIDIIEDIGQDVAEVIQGQQNDRIGLYNSGLNLYLESRSIQDPQFKMLVASQALKSLSDGNEQIMQAMRVDMRYLLDGKYKQKKGKSTEEIEERMRNINKSFDIIHRSYLLRSAIYYERNEIPAMLSTMDEYGKFLRCDIIPNAPLLTEFDRSDVLLQDGKWERRALMFSEIGSIKKQLADTNVYYLEIEEKSNG